MISSSVFYDLSVFIDSSHQKIQFFISILLNIHSFAMTTQIQFTFSNVKAVPFCKVHSSALCKAFIGESGFEIFSSTARLPAEFWGLSANTLTELSF